MSAAVQRIDRLSLRLDRDSMSPAPHKNGWVDVWGVATRSGVFLYEDPERPGQPFREWRPPEEVFDEASLQTLVGIPFTIEHPANDVDSSNWADLAHGNVLEYQVDGSLVRVRIRITTEEAKAAVRSGKIELSCGYTAFVEEVSGVTPNGEAYDAIQRRIRYNHLALVELARAGHVARLRLDGKGRVQRKVAPPMKFRKDGKTYDVPALVLAGLQAVAAEKRDDAIETAKVNIEMGGESVELVLPVSAVDQFFSLIGAVESEAPPEPTPEPPAEEDAFEETPADEMGEEEEEEFAKMDSKKLQQIVDAAVSKQLADKAKADRSRAEIERKAAPHLDAGYQFASMSDSQVMFDAIVAIDSDLESEAKSFADSAESDARALGGLEAMFVMATRRRNDETSDNLRAIFEGRSDSAAASNTPTVTRIDKARADREAARSERLKGSK